MSGNELQSFFSLRDIDLRYLGKLFLFAGLPLLTTNIALYIIFQFGFMDPNGVFLFEIYAAQTGEEVIEAYLLPITRFIELTKDVVESLPDDIQDAIDRGMDA